MDLIHETERQRLRSLVEASMEVARPLHADGFQLINPLGGLLAKEEYLGGVASRGYCTTLRKTIMKQAI